MGDGQHRALVPFQIALQPLGGVQVQVVGGLVQQQDVGVLQDEPGQVDPGLFTAGQSVERARAHVRPDAQAVADLVQPGLGVIAAPRFESGGELVVTGHHLEVRGLSHPGGQLRQLPLHGVEGGESGVQHVPDGISLRVDGDLGDEPQPLARRDGYTALVRRHLARHDAEDGGLARAVPAEQAHPLPLVHLEGKSVQYPFADLELFDEAGELYIDHE